MVLVRSEVARQWPGKLAAHPLGYRKSNTFTSGVSH